MGKKKQKWGFNHCVFQLETARNDLPRALDLTVNFKHPCASSVVKFYPLKKWIGCDHIVVVIILGLDLTVASCQIYTMNFKWQCVSSVFQFYELKEWVGCEALHVSTIHC
mgnify:CR=1 FL=1